MMRPSPMATQMFVSPACLWIGPWPGLTAILQTGDRSAVYATPLHFADAVLTGLSRHVRDSPCVMGLTGWRGRAAAAIGSNVRQPGHPGAVALLIPRRRCSI